MRHKILVPTDFSKNAWLAIKYATRLYEDEVCDFYLLNVFSAPKNLMDSLFNMVEGSESYETAKAASEKELANVVDLLKMSASEHSQHTFKIISKFNDVVEAIKNVVEEKDIEIVIMGTKGESNRKDAVFGSVAIYTMEKVRNCPVLAVPENAPHELPKEIVFPTSYKTHYKRRELQYVTSIAKKCNANIAVLHISDRELNKSQKERQELLKEIFEDNTYSFHTLPLNSINDAINIFVDSRDSDMVAFINKKHSFFGSILTNPLVKEVTFFKVPVLVLHDLRN
ncbi:universal stress protein [Kordia sp. YSTF-M3]|uniref:Universal stress protein n=1 Tax=Kordia aestuariivivens TaxID=2759037 RepID=A0ABR7QEW7_9FLAO|nr:universal stress protein [Kordia aestuariivivens]MBC8757048.1 universal stress protein [Kordia aestuariivivens]